MSYLLTIINIPAELAIQSSTGDYQARSGCGAAVFVERRLQPDSFLVGI